MENIDKMINCGDPSFGGAMYGCPHCGKLKFVPFRCHSRFCPTCGNKYSMERTTSMSFKLVNVQHRHCVFTIDENLRDFFLEDRTLLDCLFHSVTSVVSRMFFKKKEVTKIFINSKNTVAVLDINKFKRHGSSAFHGILVSAGRAETAVASEWDKFKLAAMGTTVHGTAKRWITTVDHLIDIFHLSRSRMKCIFNFFIVVSKDSL